MTHSEREEMMRRISEAWRDGYKEGVADTMEEVEKAGCVEHIHGVRKVLDRLRHPVHGSKPRIIAPPAECAPWQSAVELPQGQGTPCCGPMGCTP